MICITVMWVQVVFPMLFPRDEDVRLFDEDPIEYIRKGGEENERARAPLPTLPVHPKWPFISPS
jgi:hypothetical protein